MRILLLSPTVLACYACLLLSCASCGAAESAKAMGDELDAIRLDAQAIRRHTETLADDAFEGREAGQPGGRAAGTYILRALKQYGLHGNGGSDSYYQPFGRGYRNILAVVPGTDPRLRDEFLMLSAHYDHVGLGTPENSNGGIGSIHNGADDNASGTAAVLEIARVLAQQRRLGRSVLVVFWDAEEKGLLGSKYWMEHPTIDIESVRYVVNVDMVGRLREHLLLYGTRTMPGLRMQWSQANRAVGLPIEFPWEVINNSDHYTFFQRRVPVTMVHTGLHDDYHRFSDDVHRLNHEGIVGISQLLVQLIVDIANQPELPPFRAASLQEREAEQLQFERSQRQLQRRLGISVQPDRGPSGEGLRVQSVAEESPASQSRLRRGDLILEADGVPVRSVRELRTQVQNAGQSVLLGIVENGEAKEVAVPLPGSPQRIGLSWRTSDAEPGVVMLVGVVPGSAAAAAGCRPLDRVVQVNGQAITNSDAFRLQMEDASGTTELLVERAGVFVTVSLDVPERRVTEE